MHHFNRPKISNNSLIRDQKSNKQFANRCKKLVHTCKREAVQFFVAKNLAINHLPLEALPMVQTWTANCKRDSKAVVMWHFVVCGLQFPMKDLMLKVSIVGLTFTTYSQEVPFPLAKICDKSPGAYKRKPVKISCILMSLWFFISDPPMITHFMDPRPFKIFTGEWVHLKHVSVMKCHNYSLLHTNWRFNYTYCTLSHSEFFTNFSNGDWPVYEVTHAS